MNIVLYEPEIPQNTGNIGRTCVATAASLHLIKPLGFDISEKAVKRAGMDYWQDIDLHIYENYGDFLSRNRDIQLFAASTKSLNVYTDVCYDNDAYIMFGPESRGIPEDILIQLGKEQCIRIPMFEKYRSLNLSNSVAIILYEALRQNGFREMLMKGELHNRKWN